MATFYMKDSNSNLEAEEIKELRDRLLAEKKRNSELNSQLEHARDELFKTKKELKEEKEKGIIGRIFG